MGKLRLSGGWGGVGAFGSGFRAYRAYRDWVWGFGVGVLGFVGFGLRGDTAKPSSGKSLGKTMVLRGCLGL